MKEKRHISAEERARLEEAYRIGMEMMRRGEELDRLEDMEAAGVTSSAQEH